jgi:hypothetical protein
MEIKSEQKFEEVHFTDIDVAYRGEVRSLTLENGKDSYREQPGRLEVIMASGEVICFYKEPMHWISIRPRTLRRLVKETK